MQTSEQRALPSQARSESEHLTLRGSSSVMRHKHLSSERSAVAGRARQASSAPHAMRRALPLQARSGKRAAHPLRESRCVMRRAISAASSAVASRAR
eukprot:scaffold25001_cov57-Phaeocystis_antarctica.AAC.1